MADLSLSRRSFTEQDLIEAQRLLSATGYSLNGLNTSSGGITEQSGIPTPNDPEAVNALLGQLQGYQWDRIGDNGVYAQDRLYSPDGALAGSVEYMPAHDSMVGKDYQDMATVLAAVLGGGYALSGAGAGAGVGAASGGTNAAIANGAVMGGATGAGVGGASAAGYGGLAAGTAGTAGSLGSSGSSSFQLDPNSYGGANYSGSNMAANKGTTLADFFSGNGSTSDYLRLVQAGYGAWAQNQATKAAGSGTAADLALRERMWQASQAENQPLLDLRNSTLPKINALITNPSSITQDPGYQFQLKQGQNSLNNRAAASGNYYSGAQMKAANQYGQDYAGTKLDQSLNRLMGVANGTQIGSTNNQNANQQFAVGGGNALQQGGNIRAGGYIGQYNTVNNNLNDWMQDQTNRKYWGGGG